MVNFIEEKRIISVTSDFILQEIKEKMLINFNTPSYAANATIAYITSLSELVPLKGADFSLRDPADNKVLETAVIGKCHWLVTGDKDLLVLKNYRNINIVTPAKFLSRYK